MYVPQADCTCASVYGPSFGVMLAIIIASVLYSLWATYYFSGTGRLSPFPPPGQAPQVLALHQLTPAVYYSS